MNGILLLAVLASAQQQAVPTFRELLAAAVVPETRPAGVEPVMVLKVKAEMKVIAHGGQNVEGNLESLQRKYGFVPDQTFAPRAITGDKEFVILPYDSAPRPMYYLIKGYIDEGRVKELSKDLLIRKVEPDALIEASEESLHLFVQGYGPRLLKVEGVQSLSVGKDEQKPVLVITLLADADRDDTAERLRRAAPPLPLLPHRYEIGSKKAEPRFRTQ